MNSLVVERPDPYSEIVVLDTQSFELRGQELDDPVSLRFPTDAAFMLRTALSKESEFVLDDLPDTPGYKEACRGYDTSSRHRTVFPWIRFTLDALGSRLIQRREQAYLKLYSINPSYDVIDMTDEVMFSYDSTFASIVVDETTRQDTQAITEGNLKAVIDSLGLDIDKRVASRTLKSLNGVQPEELRAAGMPTTENFVTGPVKQVSWRGAEGRELGMKVASLPKFLASDLHSITGIGVESIALLHACSDVLTAPPEERLKSFGSSEE